MKITQEMQTLLMVRGLITSLPEEQQTQVAEVKRYLQETVQRNGDTGIFAFSLLGAEMAAES